MIILDSEVRKKDIFIGKEERTLCVGGLRLLFGLVMRNLIYKMYIYIHTPVA
jgi:hypothetical protein